MGDNGLLTLAITIYLCFRQLAYNRAPGSAQYPSPDRKKIPHKILQIPQQRIHVRVVPAAANHLW